MNSVGRGLELGEPGITETQLMSCNAQGFSKLTLKGKSFNGSCFSTWHPRVNYLDLHGTGVTDDTIKEIESIAGLVSVNLSDTKVTDACLPALRNLQRIDLSGTHVTFDGLRSASFTNLQAIQIALGQFSVDQVRELKKSIPLVVGKAVNFLEP